MNIESMPRTAGRGARRLWAALLLGALAVTALGAPVAAATTTYSGSVDFGAGKKFAAHALPVAEAGELTATLAWSTGANLDLGLQRLGDDGKTWVGVKWATSPTARPEVLTADVDPKLTYRLAVLAKDGDATPYTITADVAAASTAPAPAPDDDTHTGTVNFDAGQKFKTHGFPVTEAGTVNLSLDWDTSANLDLGLQRSSDGGKTWSGLKWTSSKTAKPETLSHAVDPAFTYRLAVSAKDGGLTNYTATVEMAAPETGKVATFSSAYGFRGPAGIYPYGMDWDDDSDTVLVADIWNHGVKRFSTGGTQSGGAFITGKGFGLPNDRIEPFDIESDPRPGNTDVYVANEAYSRVDHYRADGTWVKSVGMGAKYGQGCGGGKVYWPTNIALHPGNGRLYISDGYCGTVSAYDANFNYLPDVSFDLSHLGVTKATVRGIDVDRQGNIWLAEIKTRSLMKYAADGGKALVSTKLDRMNDPRGVAVDRSGGPTDGMVYVVGGFWNEVYRFDKTGTYLGKWAKAGTTADAPLFDAIRYVTVDGSGNVYVGDTWKYVVYKMSPDGTRQPWSAAPQPPPNGGFNQLSGVGLDGAGGIDGQRLYVADFLEQRIQVFDTHSGTTPRICSASNCSSWLNQFGSRRPNMPNSPGISYPRAMTVGGGLVWIDGGNSVVTYDTEGNFVSRFGSFGTGPGQFRGGPTGIRVTANRVYTTDTANCRIQVTDYTGSTTYAQMGSCGTDPSLGQMGLPQQLDVDEAKNLAYVADAGRSRVQVWNMGTKSMKSFNISVDGVTLNRPRGLVLDPARQWLYVSDSSNRRIVRTRLGADGYPVPTTTGGVTAAGELVTKAGDTEDGFPAFGQPRALEFGPADGRLYIGDFNQRVYAYTINR